MEMAEEVREGQAPYTRWGLHYYRFFVLMFSNRFAWRCSTRRLLKMYNQHVSANHLDVGVGTGYYISNCRFPVSQPRLGLMDINENSLRYAARGASRYRPDVYRRNVLEEIPQTMEKFDSIGVTYLLHCLPGGIEEKSIAFDHLTPLLNGDGVLFGATVVHDGPHNRIARWLLKAYNERGHFHNSADTEQGLESSLRARFEEVDVRRSGSVAIFSARYPSRAAHSTNGGM